MPLMYIDRIDLYLVAMPLISPWRTAYGEDSVIESLLVKMTSGDLVGWGEASPLPGPTYSPEWAGGAFATAKRWLAPRLVGTRIHSGAELQEKVAVFKGNPFAKSAFDLAWWDLHAQHEGQPLWRLIGGTRETVPVGADFGVCDGIDELLHQIEGAVAAGFPRIKLKFRPGWDEPMVRAVRQRFPDAVIHIDCNSGYRLSDLPQFQALDEFRLAMYEQPLNHDDVLDHAELQKQVQTPVCLDESIYSVEQAKRAIALKACRWINIKPGRVGGLTPAVIIHDLAQKAGIPCWIGGMLESAVGAAHCLALATLPNCTYPADIFPSSRFYRQDLAEPPLELCGRAVARPQPEPGIGVVPNADRLARLTVEHAVVLKSD